MSQQLSLPGMASNDKIVNTASVPHRSPFRYPGGKTWLVPRVRKWLVSQKQQPTEFVEPFAGGAIVGLTVAFEQLAQHVTLVEIDEQVAAVWQTLINSNEKDVEWLAKSVLNFKLTRKDVENILNADNLAQHERALQTIVKNRVNRGGILASGAGMLKYGENGKGISSRWYPETLYKRMMNILRVRERLTFIEDDGLQTISKYSDRADTVFFVDPPYTAGGKQAGKRLYDHWEIDHVQLFDVMQHVVGDFLMTYSNSEEVRNLVEAHGLDAEPVAMKNTHHARMTELLIGRDLDWLREMAK